MDIFTPAEEGNGLRPLAVFFHGGGFMGGSRRNLYRHCIDFAKRGYVTATVDYRKIDDLFTSPEKLLEGFSMSITDAIRSLIFFQRNISSTNDFRIDSSLIFVGGISAGGIIAAHLNFLDPKDVERADEFPYSPLFEALSSPNFVQPKAAINFSGAMLSLDILDRDDGALLSFHNAFDEVVPCKAGVSINSPYKRIIYGSCAIEDYLDSIGHKRHELLVFDEYPGHVNYMSPTNHGLEVYRKTANFLKEVICDHYKENERYTNFKLSYQYKDNRQSVYFRTDQSMSQKPKIRIYNKVGQLLHETDSQNLTYSHLNLNKLEPGLYFIQLGSASYKLTEKMILN